MKLVRQYRWHVLWTGKWRVTRYHATEEDIRREHPEARAVEGTLRVLELPDTDEERDAQARRMSHSQRG